MIPIRRARIEWNRGGPFRVSDWDDSSARELEFSGGACFRAWAQMPAADEGILVGWFFHHAFVAMQDGCSFHQVNAEMKKVGCRFDFGALALDPLYLSEVKLRKEVRRAEALPK